MQTKQSIQLSEDRDPMLIAIDDLFKMTESHNCSGYTPDYFAFLRGVYFARLSISVATGQSY